MLDLEGRGKLWCIQHVAQKQAEKYLEMFQTVTQEYERRVVKTDKRIALFQT